MRPLIAGNWKMNGLADALCEIGVISRWVENAAPRADVLVCPSFTLLSRACDIAAGRIRLGGQDCHPEPEGAFTGDVSAEMLRDAGASAVIVGHSERRRYHGETDALVAAKAAAAWRAGLQAVICIGETEEERDRGQAQTTVRSQLSGSVPKTAAPAAMAIAYEPVWAIGTGMVPSDEEIAGMHALIREGLHSCLGDEGLQVRLLYGGSVKPGNARAILALPHVNGALVGGASLKSGEFLEILRAAPAA